MFSFRDRFILVLSQHNQAFTSLDVNLPKLCAFHCILDFIQNIRPPQSFQAHTSPCHLRTPNTPCLCRTWHAPPQPACLGVSVTRTPVRPWELWEESHKEMEGNSQGTEADEVRDFCMLVFKAAQNLEL